MHVSQAFLKTHLVDIDEYNILKGIVGAAFEIFSKNMFLASFFISV